MTTRQIDTVIVGGGQAGLAMSYYLKQKGREQESPPASLTEGSRFERKGGKALCYAIVCSISVLSLNTLSSHQHNEFLRFVCLMPRPLGKRLMLDLKLVFF
jgi:hypothetical protein